MDTSFDLPELNRALLKWEVVYDTVCPSQALGYLTPLEYLQQHWQNNRKEKVLPIT
jgi:transposase InsO family protein